MKVTHLNTYTEGGAAEASLRLHVALLNAKLESKFIALYKARCTVKEVFDFRKELNEITYWFTKFKNKQRTLSTKRISNAAGEWYSEINTVWKAEMHSAVASAEIIHLHWVSGFVDIPSFFQKDLKIVWTLHDHFLFSGGFHYPPPIQGALPDSKLNEQKQLVKKIVDAHPIDIVCPSEHLKQLAQTSGILDKCRFHVIKNPIDTTVFRLLSKSDCQKKLNIPSNKKVLFFLADHIDYVRKGFPLLEKALSLLEQEVTLIVAGRGKLPNAIGKATVKHFGLVKDKTLLSELYNACDVLVNPSLNDISSNTVIEAMACGRPAVTFDSGGIPELMSDVNGIIASDKTPEALAKAITQALQKTFDGDAIVQKALREHAPELIAQKYIEVYKQVKDR